MVDFLLVHDIGQGSWCWGKVWGHLTAPVQHPPVLHVRNQVGNVVAMDLPRQEAGPPEDTPALTIHDCISAVADEVKAQGLRDLILVGHGLSAPIILQAASQLDELPKRIVLFAGIIPDTGRSAMDALPPLNRLGLKMLARMGRTSKYEFRLPKAVITSYYCNGMDPFEIIQIVGKYTPLPSQLFRAKIELGDFSSVCPVTYVPLWRDRLLRPELQKRMADRLGGVELEEELDSCHQVMLERPRQVADILLKYV